MKAKLIPFIVAFFSSTVLYAAIIDGPANVRQSPKGQKLVSLKDGVHVFCQEAVSDWYRIEIVVVVTADQVTNGKIEKGVTLKTMGGHELGVTLEKTTLKLPSQYREGISGKIVAYTHTQNIKEINGTNGCE